jgi:hypothetical protein
LNGSVSIAFGTPDRVEFHLENWARRFKHSVTPGSVGGSGSPEYMGSSDFDGMCLEMDKTTARTVDTLIEDLPAVQKYAIHNTYLHSVYRVRGQLPGVSDLEAGRVAIGRGLVKWGIY